MGVYDDDVDQDLDEAEAEFAKTRSATQYIGYASILIRCSASRDADDHSVYSFHARRQLA